MPPKGLPFAEPPAVGDYIFGDDASLPLALIRASALDHNRRVMSEFCRRHGVSLAPHGKTTMAPALFRRQLADGAWAITAANVWQATVMAEASVPRVLIANEVVVSSEIRQLVLIATVDFRPYCYVDSVVGVEILVKTLADLDLSYPLPVLVELGVSSGRTGARTTSEARAVAEAAAAADDLSLVGVSGFEGVIRGGPERAMPIVVDFLDRIVDLTKELDHAHLFADDHEIIVSAGGSVYFDAVVDRFQRRDLSREHRIVIRSGCYLTHDDGGINRISPLGSHPRTDGKPFLPAIEVWAPVLSRPEPELAILGLGRRDASYDSTLPIVKRVRRRGGDGVGNLPPMQIRSMDDQHAYLKLDASMSLDVGDLVGCGISHPCTTFDKWRSMVIVDDDYQVIEVIDTRF